MLHEPDCRGMVFVRGDCYLDVPAADIRQEFRYALKGPGHIGAVLAVVGQEQAPDAQDFFLTAAGFRKGPLKELVDAVADVGGYLRFAVDGITAGGQGLVGGRRDIRDGVQQGPVQVKYLFYRYLAAMIRRMMAGASWSGCSSGRARDESSNTFEIPRRRYSASVILFCPVTTHRGLPYCRHISAMPEGSFPESEERSKRPSPVITRSAEAISCSSPRAEAKSGTSCRSGTGEVRMADDFYPILQSIFKQRDILSLASFLRSVDRSGS